MPPKVDKQPTDKEDKPVPHTITLLQARQAAYFAKLQSIFELSRNIDSAERLTIFMNKASNISTLRSEFIETVEKLNLERMQHEEGYAPTFNTWDAFEDMYAHLQQVIIQIKDKNASKASVPQQKIALPPIQLPNFDGNSNNWTPFFERFNHLVHNNNSLSDSEKVFYLCGQLTGAAQTAISGIDPTGSNYELIYSTLVDKYQDVRSLGTSYLNQLFNFKTLTSASAEGLCNFIDKFATSVSAFEKLDISNKLDFLFLFLALKKLDNDTIRTFENNFRSEKIPTYKQLIIFLKGQCKILERTNPAPARSVNVQLPKLPAPKNVKSFVTSNESSKIKPCVLCNKVDHEQFYRCPDFMKLTPKERFNVVKKYNCCVNCLSMKHKTAMCNSNKNCGVCQSKSHHSLLHFPRTDQPNSVLITGSAVQSTPVEPTTDGSGFTVRTAAAACDDDSSSQVSTNPFMDQGNFDATACEVPHAPVSLCSMQNERNTFITKPSTVLLATARVLIVDARGNPQLVRCLIDNGSQNHFITTECCKRLRLDYNTFSEPVSVNGFGGCSNTIQGITEVTFSSRFDKNIKYFIKPLVVGNITDFLPTSRIDTSRFEYLANIPLADNLFYEPGGVEMLIGAQLFSRLIQQGRIQGPPGTPDAIKTSLGFILMGEAPILSHENKTSQSSYALCCFSGAPLDNLLRRFWELEEPPAQPNKCLSSEEEECENIYKGTTSRDPSGRYTVALPFKEDPNILGSSTETAKKRFTSLERRLQATPAYRDAFDSIVEEYLEKDYISPIADSSEKPGYIIPHHGVFRETSVSTKVRLVLDSSAKTDNGVSLNDILHIGPNLQPDLYSVLLKFRLFAVAFCADVKQMYLQIKVFPEYHKYQRIFYRFDPSDPLQLFEFKRVCFGFSSSPFLALRTLIQLAQDERSRFPLASDVIDRGDYYMDDVCCSYATVPEARAAATELIGMFTAGGFDLLKWSSNSIALLSGLPPDRLHPQSVNFDADGTQKVLGMNWDPCTDSFSFQITPTSVPSTKRNMLSVIARLWDVLGFAAPLILYAKLLIKELWLLKLDWDDVAPAHIVNAWVKFQTELHLLSNLKIPRCLGVTTDCAPILLAFADASEKAYGAVLYLHVQGREGNSTRLILAKSKVSPVKVISLARLELCAAHLMSKLIAGVLRAFGRRCAVNKIIAMSDSTIALSWIHSSPHRLKTFVANRVTKIQEVLPPENFYHIPGKDNSADCLSRGLTASQLVSHPLWMTGPVWTSQNVDQWPLKPFSLNECTLIPESKTVALPTSTVSDNFGILHIVNRFSKWSRCLRVCTYVLRFIGKLKSRGEIAPEDLDFTEMTIIRAVQQKHFKDITQAIHAGKTYSPVLRKLRPFIVDQLLRVGGRLSNSDLSFDHKHPLLLPSKDHVVNLIVDHLHVRACHAGPQHLISLLRQKYWILSARRIIRNRIHQCIRCFKFRPKSVTSPMMADLPRCRLNVSKAFAHVGVDYGGPLHFVPTRKRGAKSQKIYLCVFICLVTRAIHIETALDLSTDCFLNAFKRFLSRRGPVQAIYSDNATNFVGARSYLRELQHFLISNSFCDSLRTVLNENHITWHFIPPNAPHFGGSWESAIKSVKTHLFRVIGSQLLSYEELLTVLCQIEAVLNSRPLGILSEDPSEPLPLTPAHFLNCRPLRFLPAAEVIEERAHLISRYLLLDKLVQSYWKRWQEEYLHTLQTREKWNTEQNPVKEGSIVLLMENNAPPLHWPLGIIEKTIKGKDDRIRVALVRTKSGTFKRPVVRLCPLPSFSEDRDNLS